jgi:hypothetical protein
MAFSATDAALEGFRITRAHPKAVLAWAGVQLAMIALLNALVRSAAGEELAKFTDLSYLTASHAPAELMRLLPIMCEILAINLMVGVLFNAVLCAAVNRAVRREPAAAGLGWLRLGPDELRQIPVLLAYALIVGAVYLVGLTVAVTVLGGVLSALLGPTGAVVGGFLGVLADLALVLWVAVRLSLASPATFATGRYALFATWSLTRGRFWPLAGAYCVSWLLSLLVSVLVQTIGLVVAHLIPGLEGLHSLAVNRGDLYALAAFTDPAFLIGLLFSALAGGLTTAVALAPAPYIYRELTGAPRHVDAFA